MRAFETTSLWDTEKKEWYEEYFIDGEQVSADDYFEEMEFETFEDKEDDEHCTCLNCITDKYVNMIQETCCPNCMKDLLIQYFDEMIESFSDEI